MVLNSESGNKYIFVVINPVAGRSEVQEILDLLEAHSSEHGWRCEVYETTGKEDISAIAGAACKEGAELVLAAGGDGTITGVANGLIHTGIPMGIIPVGTGNGLARALSIPLNVKEAVGLISGPYSLRTIDALQVNDRHYILNVSVGISSRSMQKTGHEQKQRFGMAAYLWTILNEVIGVRPRRFDLLVDGHQLQVRASEILVANGAILQTPLDLFGSAESFHDGQVEAHILTAQSLASYLNLAWQLLLRPQGRKQDLRKLTVRDSIKIAALHHPQPVQADGEEIGETPVEIRVKPQALQVIVPEKQATA